jgi:hypothetical protein
MTDVSGVTAQLNKFVRWLEAVPEDNLPVIIYGAPTVGKTVVHQALRKMGFDSVDSDEEIVRLFGADRLLTFFADATKKEMDLLRSSLMKHAIVFTNDEYYLDQATFAYSRERSDLRRILKERELANNRAWRPSDYKWLPNWRPAKGTTILPYNTYISDALEQVIGML